MESSGLKLKKCSVVFDPAEHTYTLNGMRLRGVTGMIRRHLFADEYGSVPEAVLKRAAARGSEIHEAVGLWADGFRTDGAVADEVKAFACWSERNRKRWAYNEFLVTDGEAFASSIDLIDADGNLYDIKTTYELNEEYVRWQLSVYAYLTEIQCGHTPRHLYAIHLRGDVCDVVEVERIPAHVCAALMMAEVNGEPFANPLQAVSEAEGRMLEEYRQAEEWLVRIEEEARELKEKQAELKAGLLAVMRRRGIRKWDTDRLTLTVRGGGERRTLDSAKLKAEMPDVWERYAKSAEVKESLTIKTK